MKSFLASGEGVLWVGMEEVTNEDGELLSRASYFHPLALTRVILPLGIALIIYFRRKRWV